MSVPTESAEARVKKLRDRAEEIRTDAAKSEREFVRTCTISQVAMTRWLTHWLAS